MHSCRQLLQRYPDNGRYHTALQRSMRLDPDSHGIWSGEQLQALKALYSELQGQYPRSTAVFRIPLDYLVRKMPELVGYKPVLAPTINLQYRRRPLTTL